MGVGLMVVTRVTVAAVFALDEAGELLAVLGFLLFTIQLARVL